MKKNTDSPSSVSVIGSRSHGSIKLSTIAMYASIFAVIMTLVVVGYQTPQLGEKSLANVAEASPNGPVGTDEAAQSDLSDAPISVDELIATNIAANVADKADLPVATNVMSMSISLAAKDELASTDDSLIAKPSIVHASSENRDIVNYTTRSGDTVQKIAKQFNISPQTIKQVNNLSSGSLTKGTTLKILPVDGVLYTTKAGDKLKDIASQFNSDAAMIVSYNNLELTSNHLKKGTKLILPGGVDNETSSSSSSPSTGSSTNIFDSGNMDGTNTSTSSNPFSASAGNRYAPGNCTWYVYEKRKAMGRPIGSFWGNANTWALFARKAGNTVNRTPEKGAIFQTSAGYYGHVGIVESVNSDGSINVSEMNNVAFGGFNIVSKRTISASQVGTYSYIH